MNGTLVIISSPSGGGKTSIIQLILQRFADQYVYSISATTRMPRPGEVNGRDYFFLTEAQFQTDIENGRFLEYENVHGYLYGTPNAFVEKCLTEGKRVLLDLDVNGALQAAKSYPARTITIFIAPPSIEVLMHRLQHRQTDSAAEINKRLERIPMEMEKAKLFDHIVINDQLEKTAEQVVRLVEAFTMRNQ